MPLVKPKEPSFQRPITYDDPVAAKIQQRRYQILVHSLLYYDLDVTLVSDYKWAEWARELVDLQNKYPDISNRVIFAEHFKCFDASTGYNLPYRDAQIVNIARRLMERERAAEIADALHKLAYTITPLPAEYDKYKKKAPAKLNIRKEVKRVEQKPRKGLFSVPRK